MRTYIFNTHFEGTKELTFTEAGFSMGNHNCYYCGDVMLYFTKSTFEAMLKRGDITELK